MQHSSDQNHAPRPKFDPGRMKTIFLGEVTNAISLLADGCHVGGWLEHTDVDHATKNCFSDVDFLTESLESVDTLHSILSHCNPKQAAAMGPIELGANITREEHRGAGAAKLHSHMHRRMPNVGSLS